MSSRSSESESKAARAERMAALALGEGRGGRVASEVEERPWVRDEAGIARRSKASLS